MNIYIYLLFFSYDCRFSIIGVNYKFVILFLIFRNSREQINQLSRFGSLSFFLEFINSVIMLIYFYFLNVSCIIFKMKILLFILIIKQELLLFYIYYYLLDIQCRVNIMLYVIFNFLKFYFRLRKFKKRSQEIYLGLVICLLRDRERIFIYV